MIPQTLDLMSLALELHEAATHLPSTAICHQTGRQTADPAIRYCMLVVLLPLLAIPAFICLGKSDFFLHHGASVWVQSNDAIFNFQDRNCDVLVYGDSTAMTGIDPEVVNRETGFKTCNIAVTNAVLAVTGNLTLDHYLKQNTHPKVLVVQLAPDDFQQENRVWRHTIYAEGLLELLRHGSPSESRQVLLNHPHEAIAFAGYAAGFTAYYAIKDVWFRTTHLRAEEDQIQVRNGFFTPPSPARTYCESAAKLNEHSHGDFPRTLADQYRKGYSNRSAIVLVDVAPIPSCDDNLKAYSSQLEGITSNSLQSLPIGLFNDGRHYTAFGSRIVSTLVARQVNEALQKNSYIDNRSIASQANIPEFQSVSLQR
jgi:hypothetical protein